MRMGYHMSSPNSVIGDLCNLSIDSSEGIPSVPLETYLSGWPVWHRTGAARQSGMTNLMRLHPHRFLF